MDYQKQIDAGIDKADNFLFIISPHSVNSPYCRLEIDLALKRGKRIIPILHVEETSRNAWQRRHPKGTDDEWKEYVASCKHCHYTNMHPAIRKINWVYCREETDDFEKSFRGLLSTINNQKDYVHQHTTLLCKALTWENCQKQNRYLLLGKVRQEAEEWLQVTFEKEQAPCEPTDLHCEFITESTKNANNLMTQVFLSYAEEEDKLEMEKIRQSLQRHGFTVWTNKTDIQTSEDFKQAINRGIEQADNLVYLLSSASLKSHYCQQELSYALSLNKRVVPILVKPTPTEQISASLRNLQYIDLTDNQGEEDYALDEARLLNILYQDSGYHKQHKVLLAKALKWERQNHNPSILLRGYNLRKAEAWLKVAQQRTLHLPTSLHETFIHESLQQPEGVAVEVFISYSRADADFARKLNEALQSQGKTTWFDQESIASGSDFQKEICQGIENSHNFLFVISPDSVNSPYCTDEVEHAQSLNKRIVTVLHRSVDAAQLPATLRDLQWVDFNQHHDDFYASFSELIRTLDTDRAHVRSHTRWLQRATEWEQEGKSDDLLLRGSEFAVAEYWLQKSESEEKYPPATELQKTFLQVSKDAISAAEKREKRRVLMLRSLLGAASAVAVIAIFTSIFAFLNQRKAVQGEVVSLVANAEARYTSGQELEALMIGLEAAQKLQESPKNPALEGKVINVLTQAIDSVQEYNTLDGHKSRLYNLHIQSDGRVITMSEDGTARVWDSTGAHLVTLKEEEQVIEHIETNDNGQTVVTLSYDYGDSTSFITLWDLDGTVNQILDKLENDYFTDLVVSPDSQIIGAATEKGRIKLWQADGSLIDDHDHQSPISALAYSPDGQTLASAGGDRTIKLWKKGELSTTLGGHDNWVTDVTYSPDGELIASADEKGIVKLWTAEGEEIKDLKHGESGWTTVLFSPDSQTIATAGDSKVKIWNREGQRKAILTEWR
ncbi:MAG: TIR domain-containing protein [Cyanobacteria bacterium P01_C01_bin.118]